LLTSYGIPSSVRKRSGPMVPTDFFDDVVDGFGSQRHFGYFPRESSIRIALKSEGMVDIQCGTLPTPWLFSSKESAVWFVHELFGIGNEWAQDGVPQSELKTLIEWLDKYLGFYEDRYGRTLLFWQLSYFFAQRPLITERENEE